MIQLSLVKTRRRRAALALAVSACFVPVQKPKATA